MKVDPDTTSYKVKGLNVIKIFNNSNPDTPTVKVIKNISKEDEVYFLVVEEPPLREIEAPEDIKTVKKYKVTSYESRFAIRQEAVENAKDYADKLSN